MANFRGFFLPKGENAKDDGGSSEPDSESDNDDFENPDYNDIIQIATGKYQSQDGTKTRCVGERLQEVDYINGSFVLKGEKVIRARFDSMFSFPWWMVEIFEIKTSSRTQRTEKIPSYSIRCDDGIDKSLLSLFLTQGCCVNQQHVTAFCEFIESRQLKPTFVDLLSNLGEFRGSSEVNHEIARQIKTSLACTPTGKAFLVPELTKFAHRLFPRHLKALFSSLDLKVLQDMAKVLQDEPWILGYQTVMKERFGLSGCEVKLPSFVNCNLMEKMPPTNRDALYVYNALCKVTYKYGHTYVPLWKLKRNKCYEPPSTPRVYRVTTWEESLAYLREINVVKTSGDGDGRSVFLPHIRGYEQSIVRSICKMMRKKSPWVNNLEIDEKAFGGDEDQLRAAKLITTSPVVVLSGRGGCGKTHVVSTVLSKALEVKRSHLAAAESCSKQSESTSVENSQSSSDATQDVSQYLSSPLVTPKCSGSETPVKNDLSTPDTPKKIKKTDPCGDSVLLTAPTGRAASILGKRTGVPSYTLHSVIFSYLRWLKEVKNNESHSAWKFSDVKILVCDESSLISVKTFSTLVNILMKKTSLQQIVLLGDKNQLPSIEPGNFLSDVYQALLPYGPSVTLRTNHRAESQLIVDNASRICRRELPRFPDDRKRGFISLECQSKHGDDTTDSDDMAVTQVVRDLLQNKISELTLPGPDKSQFIAFRRRDCLNVNELCAVHYNNHSIKNCKGKYDFQAGDKVCVKKNIVCFDAYTKEDVKFCNGEIFFIKEVIDEEDNRKKKTTYLALDNGEKIVKVELKMLKKAKLCHAWARTIHTFQGSEIDTVVYVVGSPIYQTCQHVYTAVTRGVRQVIIIHDPRNLEAAVKTKPFSRNTKLQKFLTLDLEKPPVSNEVDSDVEGDVTTSPANDISSIFSESDDHSDVFSSQHLSSNGDVCCTGDLQKGDGCGSRTCESPFWKDEVKEEDDNEILAWALEVESSQTQRSTCNTTEGESYYISRKNLRIKQERRVLLGCQIRQVVQSGVEDMGDQTFVDSGNSFDDRIFPALRSENLGKEEADAVTSPCSLPSDSLTGHALSGTNTLSSAANQLSPAVNSCCVFQGTCNRSCPVSSAFPSPPQTPPNSGCQTETSENHFWEDEFDEEEDDEILAWASDVESSQPQKKSTWTGGEYQASGNKLNIKQEIRGFSNCQVKREIENMCEQTSLSSGKSLTEGSTSGVTSEKRDEDRAGAVGNAAYSQFSESLAGFRMSASNTLPSSINQVSPGSNSGSPKTYPRRFSESSAFSTPPHTPPNTATTPSTSAKRAYSTFPSKGNRPRSASLPNPGGTPSKQGRRSFVARFNTLCSKCRSPIRAGVDEITHLGGGSSKSWVHQNCIQHKKKW